MVEMVGLSAREESVYRLALEMARNWGRVSDETWRDVVTKDKPKAKGQEGWLERRVRSGKILRWMGGPWRWTRGG